MVKNKMLANKIALVTGASGAIGQAIAQTLAAEGAYIYLNYNQNSAGAEKALTAITTTGGQGQLLGFDVSEPAQVTTGIKTIVANHGHLDILVNNAGIAAYHLFVDTTPELLERLTATNINGPVYCCQQAISLAMLPQKSGTIINIASMWGEVGAACETLYSMTKAGLIGLTKALAKEMGPSNIRVNAVSPGTIISPMLANFTVEDLESLRQDTPLDRLGTPDDVAKAVLFLASDAASFVTGHILSVNGGFVIK